MGFYIFLLIVLSVGSEVAYIKTIGTCIEIDLDNHRWEI